ncbi:PAS domain-containing hybrid sensor histidine kinase/response regulator [Synechococcus sp. CS-1328]|uniref:PAS domain-containing hybrid sensor histidine kinase/response regulator n=1 Tax=Synechococcus sp. CS-1328 TaxID=2847976 RepID=UPI00223AF5D3|nr:PAS domain-containing protein [Synechococcus sp. CS-1328]MCT0224399.1 PAS domain-containing protein [Synechococcus sp. CS-1328]
MTLPDPIDEPHNSVDLHIQATYRLTEALVEAEERMRRRINMLSEVVFETDAEDNFVFLNHAWQTITGHPQKTSLNRSIGTFIHPDDHPVWIAVVNASHQGSLLADPNLRIVRADGSIAWMDLSVAQIPQGGLVGAMRDITQSKAIKDELVKLSLVASYTQNLVLITNRDGLTEWVNQAFIERTGYSLDDMLGRKPGDVLQGPGTDPEAVAGIRRLLKEGRSFSSELQNYTKAGEPYWVNLNITPVWDDSGEIERFISVQKDSTELHQTQDELTAAKIRAEEANEAKSRFLATISHEMRTPLNGVIVSSELALVDRDDPTALNAHLLRIRDSGNLLLRLINDILDVSKIEAGQIDIEPSRLRLRFVLEEALAPMTSKARAKGLNLSFDWDDSLPLFVISDRDRLRQILTNLVENAVKFTDEGHVRVKVSRLPASRGHPEAFELAVGDSGLGIAPETQARIFEPFEQGDSSTTRRKSGVGLGLNIVRSIVSAMGGTVHLHSQPGTGTELRVILPLVPAEPAPDIEPNRREEGSGSSRPESQSGCHILVAEDSNVNFTVVKAVLRKGGYSLERAHDGLEAVAAAHRCDLVLMDLEMPNMDGLEATRRIRADERARHSPPVPVIALTAHALKEYQERCLAAGCTGYLTKPIRMEELLEAVGIALRHGRGSKKS